MIESIAEIYRENPDENFLKKRDFLVSVIFDRPITVPIVRLMQKLDFGVHPNVLSIISLTFSLLAGFLFFGNQLVLGAISYLIYFMIDGVDGKWARLTRQTSKLGERLDYYFAVLGGLAMYSGLWHSQFYCSDMSIEGIFVIFFHYSVVGLYGVLLKNQFYNTGVSVIGSYYTPEEEAFLTFFVAAVLNMIPTLMPIAVSLQVMSLVILLVRQQEKQSLKEIKENFSRRLLKLRIE